MAPPHPLAGRPLFDRRIGGSSTGFVGWAPFGRSGGSSSRPGGSSPRRFGARNLGTSLLYPTDYHGRGLVTLPYGAEWPGQRLSPDAPRLASLPPGLNFKRLGRFSVWW